MNKYQATQPKNSSRQERQGTLRGEKQIKQAHETREKNERKTI